jgi:hypothetical protein
MRRDDVDLPVAPAHDRPSAQYRCGKTCSGENRVSQSCPLGPSASGVCRHDKEPCVPVATAFGRSRRWRWTVFACGLLSLAIFSFLWGREFYRPGPLSTPHAQILAGQLTTASCAACHPQAEQSPLAWFLSGHDGDAAVQSDRCMSCHHTQLPSDFARTAHNLSPSQLEQLRGDNPPTSTVSLNRFLPNPAFTETDVDCSACHREHGGANADLTSLSDAQCQTCHSNRFTSFAVDHPSWDDWPYTNHEPIAFDHRSHSQRHFPATRDSLGNATNFDCIRCHAKTPTGEFARIVDYATACGACHDKALNQQTSERIDLFVLPSLVAPDENRVGTWPTAATGFYDGKIGALTRLLLSSSESVQKSIDSLPSDGDFGRINPEDTTQREAAETIAVAIRDLMLNMATQGPIPVAEDKTEHTAPWQVMLQGLPPQLIWDASQRWFNGTLSRPESVTSFLPRASFRMAAARGAATDDDLLADPLTATMDSTMPDDPLLADDDLLMSDPLAADPLAADPLAADPLDADPLTGSETSKSVGNIRPPAPLALDPTSMQPHGGWYADDSRIAISYRGHGHADPVIRAAIELAVGLPVENSIRRDLLASGPAVACLQCHQGIRDKGIGSHGTVTWRPTAGVAQSKSRFTKFSHQPHNNIPLLTDCKHCHRVAEEGASGSSMELTTVRHSMVHDFSPMTRQTCIGCHIPQAAGDACITCHRYHTEPMTGF